jgi:VWFA-related protein
VKIRAHLLPYVAGVLFASAVGISGQAPPAQPAPPVFPSRVDLVTVDVVVLDREGKPVEGLTAADFTVKESGQPQSIAAFEAVSLHESPPSRGGTQRVSTNTDRPDSAGRWFFIVLDDLNISQFSTVRARDAMVEFVERGLRPGDSVMIAPTSGGAWWTGSLPEDKASLIAFLKRFEGTYRPDTSTARLWDHEAMGIALGRDPQALARVARRYFEQNIIPEAYPMDREIRSAVDVSPGIAMIQTKARQVYKEATNRLRGSLDTLERISTAVAQMRGRKTLLLVSEGFIMDPTQTEFRELVQSARNANAAVHFVDVRNPAGALGQAGMPGGDAEYGAALQQDDTNSALAFASLEADGARSVAIDTGGRVLAGVKLVDDLTRIADENRNYYLLGYTPTNTKRDGKFRKIEVTVARPGVEVRARGGYYAPSDKEARPPKPDALDPSVRAALLAPFNTPGLPLRLTSYVFGQQADGKMQVMLLTELDPTPLANEAKEGLSAALDSYVLIHGRDSGNVERSEKVVELEMPPDIFAQARRSWVPLRREFTLPPGEYQASFVVRDRGTGLVGSVRHEFDVPAAGEFRASTPILTDAVQSAAMPGQPPRPVPIARRQFAPGSRVFCVFEVYGAATDAARGGPRLTVGYRLTGANGADVLAVPPQPVRAGALGQVSVTIVMTAPEQAAGDHELRVTVRDEVSTRTLEISEPLVIARP